MESPKTWDLLTSSLAASNLDEPLQAWAFLLVQGLVRDEPGALAEFTAIVQEVRAQGPITGPSEPLRIASKLGSFATQLARTPDPDGLIAMARRRQADDRT